MLSLELSEDSWRRRRRRLGRVLLGVGGGVGVRVGRGQTLGILGLELAAFFDVVALAPHPRDVDADDNVIAIVASGVVDASQEEDRAVPVSTLARDAPP